MLLLSLTRLIALSSALCALLLALAASEAQAPDLPETVGMAIWRFGGGYELAAVPEPSGMCFVPSSQTFYVVDDGGAERPAGVFHVSLEGAVLRSLALGKDLEGICYDPGSQRLYVADEADETVWVVDEPGLTLSGSFTVSREWKGREVLRQGGNGFEGIEFIARTPAGDGGYLLLLNQDDPHALLRVDLSAIDTVGTTPVPFVAFHPLPALNAGELHYDASKGQLWVVHSWQNVYEVLDIDSLAQLSWEVCPGLAQEALCFDHQGRLWIGSDTGGLAWYSN